MIIHYQGRDIYVEISPCSHVPTGYGLQIRIASKLHACNAESEFCCDRTIGVNELSPDDLSATAVQQALRWLDKHGIARLDKNVAKWAKVHEAYAKSLERRERAKAKRLKDLAKKGYTHILEAWIHPASGSDYPVELVTCGAPTQKEIRKILKESVDKTDYKITCLT